MDSGAEKDTGRGVLLSKGPLLLLVVAIGLLAYAVFGSLLDCVGRIRSGGNTEITAGREQGVRSGTVGDAANSDAEETDLGAAEIKKQEYPSPYDVACSPDGKRLFVSNHTSFELAVLDTDKGEVLDRIDLKRQPAGLVVAPDGSRVYVACGSLDGEVAFVDAAAGKIVGSVAVGHTPTDLVLSPNGKRIYCCNRFTSTISIIDVDSASEIKKISVEREPVAVALTPDAKTLLVAHHLPLGPATGDYVGSGISFVDLTSDKITLVNLANGATGIRGLCVSPDGTYAYVTQILGHYQLPTTQVERGWMNTNALGIVKVAEQRLLNTVVLDDVDRGAANSWGIACSPDGKSLYVAHSGTHELSIIDRKGLHDRLDQLASGKKVATSASWEDVPTDLAFLFGLRLRVQLEGRGPRGLALHGSNVFLADYFSDSVSVVDIAREVPSVKDFKLCGPIKISKVRRGEMLFNDATTCMQHWQSCASCHPDGRGDGINWDLLNDGVGNPKNSRSLLLSHKTPPVMSLGVRAKAEVAVRSGFKYILFARCGEEEFEAVDAYLKSMRPVPSPELVNGKLSAAAVRGKKVFKTAGCASCHCSPHYTSLASYDLGYGKGQDIKKAFDTPTLIESWRTGPYLFDGRAVTLEEVFILHNAGDKHGTTSNLSSDELNDLVTYIRSL